MYATVGLVKPQALFFANVWPEPRSSAAGVRTVELTSFLQELGYDVIGVSPLAPSEHSEAREGVRTLTVDPNSSSDFEVLRTFSPSLIIFDRFYTEEKYGWRARELWPEALQMIDTIDIHCLRGARQRAHRAGAPSHEEFFEDDYLREMASLHRADVSLVVSAYEAEWLTEQGLERDRVCYLPFSAAPESALHGFDERSGYGFIGNYMHAPNLDAAVWLSSELWPAVRRADPRAELHLYGAYPTQAVLQMNGKNGVRVHGYVEDHRAAIAQHRVMLAPLRFGAGIKGKVLEAWATGTPVLGTPIAFESMGEDFAEFNDADSFVSQLQRLNDPPVWQAEVSKGLARLRTTYDRAEIFKTFSEFLARSLAGRDHFRQSLTGRLLRHHGAQSIKYMSLWIEEKNKKR